MVSIIRYFRSSEDKEPTEKSVALSSNKADSKIVSIKPQTILKSNKERLDLSNTIYGATKAHNITEVTTKPNANEWISKALLILLYAGGIAGIIGLGGLLPHLGINHLFHNSIVSDVFKSLKIDPSSLTISGIPLGVSIGLVTLGSAAAISFIGLRIAAKKSTTAQEYYKAIMKVRSDWFIDSNLNDLLGALAFLGLAVVLFINIPHMGMLQGCLNYPFGALLVTSGIYQIVESYKGLKNAIQVKDKQKILNQSIKIFNSFLIMILGATAIFGLMNNSIIIGMNFFNGAISFGLAAYDLITSSLKTLSEINKINGNDYNQIKDYLLKTLKLTSEEIQNIEKGILEKITDTNAKEYIKNWIKENSKNWEEKQKEKWQKIEKTLTQASENEIEEIKKLILNEEIQKAQEKKLEDFRALVDQQTYTETLDVIEKINANKTIDNNLEKLFATIKKQVVCKMSAEIAKLLFYGGFVIFPLLSMTKATNFLVYNIGMTVSSALSLLINLTPRFRNIPPAKESLPFDINEKINTYPTQQKKESSPSTSSLTPTPTQKMFDLKAVKKIADCVLGYLPIPFFAA
jgi:hypothetical protein